MGTPGSHYYSHLLDVETKAQSDEERAQIHTGRNKPLPLPRHTAPAVLGDESEMLWMKREHGETAKDLPTVHIHLFFH